MLITAGHVVWVLFGLRPQLGSLFSEDASSADATDGQQPTPGRGNREHCPSVEAVDAAAVAHHGKHGPHTRWRYSGCCRGAGPQED